MARNPVELGHQDSDRLGPLGDLHAEQPLDCHRIGKLAVEGRQVVHPGDIGRALPEGELFGGLLHPGVEIADDRLGSADDLAFELELEPENTVCRRVLRAHVDDHPLVVAEPVVKYVIVGHDPAELLIEAGLRLVAAYLLGAFVRRGILCLAELGLFGASDPDVDDVGALGGFVGFLVHVIRPDGLL